MKINIITSLSILFLCQCASSHRTGPIPAPEVDDPACITAEANLKIVCPEVAKPTKKGKNFAQWCVETENNGINMNPKCLTVAKSCKDADLCLQDYSNITNGVK
jgi:hypothetical protein